MTDSAHSMELPVFYSQNGEDFVLHELFKTQARGSFVEVGCIDGRRFSNTLLFEERGWRGLCIEAHADYIELLRQNRPGSFVCHCAVGSRDEDDVTFYANRRGSLSTLDGSQEEAFRARFGHYFSGFERQRVAKRTLSTLFSQYDITDVDILSIDVEGGEADVLLGMDWVRCRPRAIVVEADTVQAETQLDAILSPARYTRIGKLVNNCFYLSDHHSAAVLRGLCFSGSLIHTQHPLDDDGDKQVKFSFNADEFFSLPA